MPSIKQLIISASFVVAALAQSPIGFTQTPSDTVTAGVSTTLEWTGGNAQGTSFDWTPSSSLANGDDYSLEISQGTDVSVSGSFAISSGQGATSSLPEASTTFFSSLSTSTTLAPSASASSVSAALSSLSEVLSSLATSRSVIIMTTTVGTASVGTGVPIAANTTFVSQTLTAPTGASTTSDSASGSTGSPTAVSTGGAAGLASSLILVLSAVVALVCVS
ncbi:MAG: hypothetical protein Q9187_002349 [Circinaria calcarea]